MPTPPDNTDIRLTRLETSLPYIEEDLKEARVEIAAIKRGVTATLWSVLFAVLLAVFGVIFRKLDVP